MSNQKIPSKNSSKNGLKLGLFLLGLAVLAFLLMDFNSRVADLRRLTAESEIVREQVKQHQGTQAALQVTITYSASEAAVRQWAYEEGHMVKEGDNPVIPMAAAPLAPTPTPTPAVQPTQVSNWDAWLSLFFGKKP